MPKRFIGNIRLLKKEVVELSLIKHEDISADEMQVTMTVSMSDNDTSQEFSKDDQASINVMLDLEILDADNEHKSLFEFNTNILMQVVFLRKMAFEQSIASDFPEEILSLVYDDFRFIAEENINRTAFKDFRLPVDFRSAVPIQTP